ncbi:uncharacterized protein MONOS_981 [Monocercomonoides exilis]|uniref:uncharacterized protein n=1 Tax=Monocercomonoides exilis TaxID=2049356 RepID=UPI00355AB935|nr:hypothetical protein MONOS_981 [Monocercomonoides exilis]|eukprot:MONOS_981.1-p1 / transcript=MONOS_981.1 / gene=MONOS_981 / organism=Monocercomonoides_exilis_PA203 / gene_product=unspecified product / transcript_product=unspecified product / location=Mono_scaffold00016:142327-142734(+) / protein_length=136 / sequence_SO=supercontig / SO=protein_coding / is_pseudo=false
MPKERHCERIAFCRRSNKRARRADETSGLEEEGKSERWKKKTRLSSRWIVALKPDVHLCCEKNEEFGVLSCIIAREFREVKWNDEEISKQCMNNIQGAADNQDLKLKSCHKAEQPMQFWRERSDQMEQARDLMMN